MTEVETPLGNIVSSYDIERTICDMVLKEEGYKMVNQIIRKYLQFEECDLSQLATYAITLGMSDKIQRQVINYLEIMM